MNGGTRPSYYNYTSEVKNLHISFVVSVIYISMLTNLFIIFVNLIYLFCIYTLFIYLLLFIVRFIFGLVIFIYIGQYVYV